MLQKRFGRFTTCLKKKKLTVMLKPIFLRRAEHRINGKNYIAERRLVMVDDRNKRTASTQHCIHVRT